MHTEKVPQAHVELTLQALHKATEPTTSPEFDAKSRFAKALHVGKRAVQSAIILAELGPTNEMIRYGTFAASQTVSNNPLVGAAVLGGTTFMVEAGAALASADIIAKSSDGKVMDWTRNKITKIFNKSPAKPSPITEAGIAMIGGSVVVNSVRQLAEPQRTAKDNRKHGLTVSGLMSGYFAAEGALMSKGIETLGIYKTVGASILAFAGVHLVFNKIANRENKEQVNDVQDGTETH